jgi:hypothetical protein
MRLRNVLLMLWDQMPLRRFWKNLVRGHIRRKFNKRSHYRFSGTPGVLGVPKIIYPTKASAKRAAENMASKAAKRGEDKTYSYYKCVWCDGYHVGSNIYRRDKP